MEQTENKKNKIMFFTLCFIMFIAVFIRIYSFICLSHNLAIDECHSIDWFRYNWREALTYFNSGANFLPGYKAILKSVYEIFGYNIVALKFVSLISAILSVFLFKSVAFKLLKNKILAICAMAAFAMNYCLVFYSSIIKPYETDVLLTLFIINFFLDIDNNKQFFDSKKKYLYGLIFLLIMYSSNTSIVVFGVCSLSFLIKKIIEKNKQAIRNILLFFIPCAFLLSYLCFFYLRQALNSGVKEQWLTNEFNFMPASFKALNTLFSFAFFRFSWWDFDMPVHLPKYAIILILILFLLGTYNFLRKQNIASGLYVCLSIYTFVFLSFLYIYPFTNRCITFLIPLFIILVFKSFDYETQRKNIMLWIGILIFMAYFIAICKYYYIEELVRFEINVKNDYNKYFYSLNKLGDNEVFISFSTICYKCFDNKNVKMLPKHEYFTNGSITPFFFYQIEGKDKVYINYSEVDDTQEEINSVMNYLDSLGFTTIEKVKFYPTFSYYVLERNKEQS